VVGADHKFGGDRVPSGQAARLVVLAHEPGHPVCLGLEHDRSGEVGAALKGHRYREPAHVPRGGESRDSVPVGDIDRKPASLASKPCRMCPAASTRMPPRQSEPVLPEHVGRTPPASWLSLSKASTTRLVTGLADILNHRS
jgi:hypothetical protein